MRASGHPSATIAALTMIEQAQPDVCRWTPFCYTAAFTMIEQTQVDAEALFVPHPGYSGGHDGNVGNISTTTSIK